MTTPLAATHRIEFQYVVDGDAHKWRIYVGLGGASTPLAPTVQLRAPLVEQALSLVADGFWDAIAGDYKASTASFGDAILQEYSGGAWLPYAVYTTALVGTSSSPYIPAGQVTTTMRDSAFHKVRFIALESDGAIGKKTVHIADGSIMNTPFGHSLLGTTGGAPLGMIWNWARGRSDLYLASPIAMVSDLNDKLRRRRGIA